MSVVSEHLNDSLLAQIKELEGLCSMLGIHLFSSFFAFRSSSYLYIDYCNLEDCAVISKQFGGRRLDHIWEVINEG